MTETTEIHTLAGAYALDALSEIERAGFARHVAECAACSAEVAELTETAARLGAATPLAPPPSLRAKVMAEIGRTRQVSDVRPTRPSYADNSQRWRRRTLIAAAAAVLAVAGLGAVWTVEENRLSDARTEAAQLQEQASVLTADDLTIHTTTVAGGGRVTVALSPSQNRGVVVMSDLPALPVGMAYQLWLIHDSSPTSAGVMAAGARSGTALLSAVDGAQTLGVTVEPAGGSTQPTLPTVVGVPLA